MLIRKPFLHWGLLEEDLRSSIVSDHPIEFNWNKVDHHNRERLNGSHQQLVGVSTSPGFMVLHLKKTVNWLKTTLLPSNVAFTSDGI